MKIEQTIPATISELWRNLAPRLEKAKCVEEAAQELVTDIHEQFAESVVIARVFLTAPFGKLPEANKDFVQKLAESAGRSGTLPADTPVLSLIGTHGTDADWNDRRRSKGHVGIPLVSADFVGAIPMISRLLKELGVPLDWVNSHDAEIVVKTLGRSAGVFFVENAAEAQDEQGRKIIAAQDFVSKYGVKTVFGTGGAYLGGEIVVIVVFCRETLPKAAAEHFLELKNLFQDKTSHLVDGGKVFAT